MIILILINGPRIGVLYPLHKPLDIVEEPPILCPHNSYIDMKLYRYVLSQTRVGGDFWVPGVLCIFLGVGVVMAL